MINGRTAVAWTSVLSLATVSAAIAWKLRSEAFSRHPSVADIHSTKLLAREAGLAQAAGRDFIAHAAHQVWSVTADDHVKLSAFFFPGDPMVNRCAVIFHGQRASAEEMGLLGSEYRQVGYSVVIVDERAHGSSGGQVSGLGWWEQDDCIRWVQRTAQHFFDANVRIVCHGVSMGANALLNASPNLPASVTAVIADSAFTSTYDILAFRLQKRHLPAFPIIGLAAVINSLTRYPPVFRAKTTRRVACARIPILYIHAAKDDQNPANMSRQLYENSPRGCELWIVPARGHGLAYTDNKKEYMRRVFAFIDSNGSETS